MGNVRVEKEYEEFQKTGTTVDADVAVLDLDTRRRDCLSILIKNTGGANGLTYTVKEKAKYGGDLINAETPANIAFGAQVQLTVTAKYYAEYIIYVKAQVGSSQTTYEIEAIQKGG